MNKKKSAKELREDYKKKLKELQDTCNHPKTEITTYAFAPGHFGSPIEICIFCEKIIKTMVEEI